MTTSHGPRSQTWPTPGKDGAGGKRAGGSRGRPLNGHTDDEFAVAVIGLGPWGLAVLERLIEVARRHAAAVTIHVVEPSVPGSGIFDPNDPDYLLLNTPCGQHVIHPTGPDAGAPPYAQSLYHWARTQGYSWVGSRCLVSDQGREITPHDFLPRRLMGEWLRWSYAGVVRHRPANVSVAHHATLAVDIHPTVDGREMIRLADGSSLRVDHAILTTGHTPQAPPDDSKDALDPYPVSRLRDVIRPGDTVAVAGLGLVALDVIAALTVGRGGSFGSSGQQLRYRPSGKEPSILLFSRSGHPYAAKAVGATDPTGDYQPVICTLDAVTQLRLRAGSSAPAAIDFRREVLPLVIAEMQVRFYRQSAALTEKSAEAAEAVSTDLARAWVQGRFAAAAAVYASRYGEFDFQHHLFGEPPEHVYQTAEEYQKRVYEVIAEDLAESVNEGLVSPVKAAYETLRVLRDTLRSVVEFRGLTLDSYVEFHSVLSNRLKAAVAGPPARRAEELLALIDAGVVAMPWGPSPEVHSTGGSGFTICSTRLSEPYVVRVDHLVRGHLSEPTIAGTRSPLIGRLAETGRIRTLRYGEVDVGSVDLTCESHPRDAQSRVQERIWIFGCLTEGARYFTQYVPSPKSRARAFFDAEDCAERIFTSRGRVLGAGAEGGLRSGEALLSAG